MPHTFRRALLGSGERTVLLLLGSGLFLIFFGAMLGQNVALAIVLKEHGAESLPRIYIANALFLALTSYAATRVVARLPLRQVLLASFVVGAAAVEAIRWAYASGVTWAPGGLYVTAFVVSDLTIVLFWSLANRVYDTRDAKRLFPLVSAAGTLGAALSGFFARGVVTWVPTEDLLDLWAILLIGCALWSHLATRRAARSELRPASPGAPRLETPASEPQTLNRPLWWAIGAGLVGVVVVTLIGRYLYGLALKQAYQDDLEQLTAVNGLLIGLSSLLTLGVQLFMTSRLLVRFGVGLMGLVYPVVMLGAFGELLADFGLAAAVFCFFGITTIRQGIQGVVENMLYTPLPPDTAARALVFMAGVGMPIGMACAGVGLEVLKHGRAEIVAVMGLAAAAGLLAAALWRSRAYREALRRRLLKGGSDVRVRFGALLDESNATMDSILEEGLDPDDPNLPERLKTLVRAHERAEHAGAARREIAWDESSPLGRVVEAKLRESYRLHAALETLPVLLEPEGIDALWRGAIRHRLGENVAVILMALRAGTHCADFGRISPRVFDADRRVRAAAVEILDSVCPERLRPLIVPLLEERHLAEGRRAASQRYGPVEVADPVEALFAVPDDWIHACTAYAVAHTDPVLYLSYLTAGRGAADRCLAFSCEFALARL